MIRFQQADASWSLEVLSAMRLATPCELGLLRAVLAEHVLAECLEQAETIHLHVKVDDTKALPRPALEAAGGVLDYARDGFVKYRLPGGINAIFSHIAVSVDDLREEKSGRRPRPFLDHLGIDVRRLDAETRRAFAAVPSAAARRGWVHSSQGGEGRPVRCCHVEVAEKHWLFPAGGGARPIEIALGPLRQGGASGCDLRPSHPALTVAAGCCPAQGSNRC
jgi:hypothetical protein